MKKIDEKLGLKDNELTKIVELDQKNLQLINETSLHLLPPYVKLKKEIFADVLVVLEDVHNYFKERNKEQDNLNIIESVLYRKKITTRSQLLEIGERLLNEEFKNDSETVKSEKMEKWKNYANNVDLPVLVFELAENLHSLFYEETDTYS